MIDLSLLSSNAIRVLPSFLYYTRDKQRLKIQFISKIFFRLCTSDQNAVFKSLSLLYIVALLEFIFIYHCLASDGCLLPNSTISYSRLRFYQRISQPVGGAIGAKMVCRTAYSHEEACVFCECFIYITYVAKPSGNVRSQGMRHSHVISKSSVLLRELIVQA